MARHLCLLRDVPLLDAKSSWHVPANEAPLVLVILLFKILNFAKAAFRPFDTYQLYPPQPYPCDEMLTEKCHPQMNGASSYAQYSNSGYSGGSSGSPYGYSNASNVQAGGGSSSSNGAKYVPPPRSFGGYSGAGKVRAYSSHAPRVREKGPGEGLKRSDTLLHPNHIPAKKSPRLAPPSRGGASCIRRYVCKRIQHRCALLWPLGRRVGKASCTLLAVLRLCSLLAAIGQTGIQR